MLCEQQVAVVDHAVAGHESLLVPAGAGCGKTSTLCAVAQALSAAGQRVVYLAYNRALKQEAQRKFGATADVYTAHGIAYAELNIKVDTRQRQLGRIFPRHVMELLGLDGEIAGLSAYAYAHAIVTTLTAYEQSGDPIVTAACVPGRVRTELGCDDLIEQVVEHAQDLFHAAAPGEKSRLPLPHDLYLKYWQVIGTPGLDRYDVVLLDEAQDSNAVVLAALAGRRVIYVGDTHQQIYSFRGAVDAMQKITALELPLTHSFRFGPVIADLANAILCEKKKTKLRYPLQGYPRLNTSIVHRPPPTPCTRIYRTNYQLIADSFVLRDSGLNVLLNGDMSELARQLESVDALAGGDRRLVRDPLVRGFKSYSSLIAASKGNGPFARELRQIVRILTDFAPRFAELLSMLKQRNDCEAQDANSVVLTTAHKAKGAEWRNVVVMGDFDQTLNAENQYSLGVRAREEELNLLYVAVTRATENLNIQGEYLSNIAIRAGLMSRTGYVTNQ
ncbi:UvrD-helicase domain-containing protein [Salinisphaera sp. T31B1]|uniref:UvrD-helicase domain-containing protein n=1 Tax=Salinisphaera sp. T31B1 TaxID=727963 RepID=UPI00333EC64A